MGNRGRSFALLKHNMSLQLGQEIALTGNEPLLVIEWEQERIVLNRLGSGGHLQRFTMSGKQEANLIWEESFEISLKNLIKFCI